MRVVERIIEYRSRSAEFTLYPLADIHLGNRACDEDRLDATLDAIAKNRKALYILLGDQYDAIKAKDPRFDVRTLPQWLLQAWHGGDLSGGVALKLEREMARYDADLFLMGHHHKILTHAQARPIRVNDAMQLVQPPDKQGAICGTFLRGRIDGVDTYQERKGYRPNPASTEVLVKIRPDKCEVDVVKRTRQVSVVL